MALLHLMAARRKNPVKFDNDPAFWIALEKINNARRATRGQPPADIVKLLKSHDETTADIQDAITCINNHLGELIEETASWCDGVNVQVTSTKRKNIESDEPRRN